jgi:hypothetical protein
MEQGFIIDRLTNSILNAVSGDSFQTDVIRLGKSDLKNITKQKGFEGYVAFTAKNKLINHYEKTLGASRFNG